MPMRVIHSLGFRLFTALVLTIGGVLAIYAAASFDSTQEHLLRMVRADVDRSSQLIMRATHDGMLLNRKDEVQATIKRLAEGPAIAAIRICDKDGNIVMSARKEEIGRRIPPDSETCRSCHDERKTAGVAILEQSSLAKVDVRPDILRQLTAIANEPGCSAAACHAHPATKKVLGVLDLEMSRAPVVETIRVAQRQFLWTTVALLAIVAGVVAAFIKGVLARPIAQLCAGTQRIAEGDLETRIQVRGRHELARLAESFNRMAEDLSAARREVTRWSQTLEQKVVEKTEELGRAQRQVLHMEKMASLGKLSATVAHELNNPLTGMLTYARLTRRELEEQPLPDEVRSELVRYLTLIEQECSRCGTIVQNLLLFTRRSGATMALTDVNEVVRQSLMLVEHHVKLRGLKLRSQLLSGDSQIVADAGQLRQALVALLVNAIEAMQGLEEGRGELTVRLVNHGEEMWIETADNGSGIPQDVLPHIFEPFFSTKEAENGVGLGLAVVYGIVQRHGGTIEVDSAPGRGTLFRLRLPRCGPAAGGGQGSVVGGQ